MSEALSLEPPTSMAWFGEEPGAGGVRLPFSILRSLRLPATQHSAMSLCCHKVNSVNVGNNEWGCEAQSDNAITY